MPEKRKPSLFGPSPIVLVFLMLIAIAINSLYSAKTSPTTVSYSEFLQDLRAGRVKRAEIRANEIIAEEEVPKTDEAKKPGAEKPTANAEKPKVETRTISTERLPHIDETKLIDEMREHGVELTGKIEEPSMIGSILYGWLIPMAIVFAIYFFGIRRLQSKGGPMSFGRNRAKLYDAGRANPATFQDVAGVDEAVEEMTEVVDFLKNPKKYLAVGAKIPKGVLLVGTPGTGKTLMARAVAGEANVPFFSMSGSDFVEMFVGVGAARVRDLFEQAKERSPCIIFIDEIDAIGKSRGGLGAMAVHDEREQTLNQLLNEMDGFDATQGVVIIAATNRPEVLDPALIRAGRFDRTVVVDRPSWDGRLAILRVHTRGMTLGGDVNLEVVARRTPGMVGADLAKVANEAALAAARRNAKLVEQRDFEEAIDRIQLGLKKRSRAMNELEKRRVAYHESGHAIVALSVDHADPVHRVTIIPRTIGALGATLQLPTEDRYLALRSELRDQICVMLGGRASEEITLGDLSTGAQNDLERATETARQMVCRFGMSDRLGAQTFGRPMGARFLDSPVNFGEERNFSEETAKAIDEEVRSILEAEHARARSIIERRRNFLDAVAEKLLLEETLERSDLDEIAAALEQKVVPPPRLKSIG
jgi:cell division protease FtsH